VGAPEVIMAGSRVGTGALKQWEHELDTWSSQGLRVIAVGHRRAGGEKKLTQAMLAKPCHFLGLVAFADPVRTGVAKALAQAAGAGLQLKVITGDYAQTAAFVLLKLGKKLEDGQIMEGHELEELSEAELDHRMSETVLFARITPSQKLNIVESLQRLGQVVAMTGDGVNDAPALRQADIGVVVSGASDVSKETADVVLLNDDFSTIVAAVEEGRGIFHNLQKILLYLLSDAFAEIVVVVGSLLLRLPLPITAAQILWVNLVNDGFPNLALTLEPKPRGLLKLPPIRPGAPLIDTYMKVVIATVSGLTGVGVLASFWFLLQQGRPLLEARTFAFSFLALSTLTYVFSTRALHRPIWDSRILKNPWLIGAVAFGFVMQVLAVYFKPFQQALGTMPLTEWEWLVMMIMAIGLVFVIELIKWVFFTHMVERLPRIRQIKEKK
jgi:Ca2+-transporting ATPase